MAEDSKSKDTRLEDALARFQFVSEAERAQRMREVEAAKFAAGDQWTDEARQMRQGQPNGSMPAIGARPCLTINLIAQPLQQVVNQFHEADLGMHVAPKGEGASEDTAAMLDEFYLELQHESRANVARGWAFRQAVTTGRGYYRILTDYESDESYDQKLCIERILNQQSVYLDPFFVKADASDAEWAFITEDLPLATFKRRYPDSLIATADDSKLETWADKAPGWVTTDQTGKSIRVAEYWYCDYETEDVPLPDGAEEDAEPRTVERRHIKWCKISAAEILEESDWDGKWIPIVLIPGREWHLGTERRWDGLPADSMDANRSYNAMRSAQVEAVALAPKPPWLVAVGQVEDFKTWWDNSNVINFPYLPYKTQDSQGNVVGPPTRTPAGADIQAITVAVQQSQADVRATSGIPESGLGNDQPNQGQRSGRAILALQRQMEHGTSHYLNNLTDIALPHEARIVLNLIRKVYDRPGRQVHVRAKDGKRRKVLLNVPYQDQGQTKHYDLTKGDYHATATVSKSFTSRREMEAEALAELIKADPTLMQVFGDVYLDNENFPQHSAMALRMRAVLDPRVQQTLQTDGQVPPQLQAQMAQASGMIQQLQAQLAQAQQIIQTKQVESAAKLEEAKLDNATKVQIALINQSGQLAAVDAKVGAENARTFVESLEARLMRSLDAQKEHIDRLATHMQTLHGVHEMAHEAAMQGAQHAHERLMAHEAAANAAAMAASQPTNGATNGGE